MRRFLVGTLMLLAGCSAGGTGPRGLLRSWRVGTNQAGYTVASAGKPDRALIRGTWDFQIAPDSSVAGAWSSYWLVTDTLTPVGPQVGSGTLSGRLLDDGTLSIDMNPGWVDNNVIVRVAPLDATWVWSTIAGPWTGGPFRLDPLTL